MSNPAIIKGVNPDIPTVRWLAKQAMGMAGALDAIHNPRYEGQTLPHKKKYGRHGDIKPENILWYPSPTDDKGILVLVDLGHTMFNTTRSRSKVPGQDVPASSDYRPPECDLKGGVISRAFDVGTVSCLLLDMCTWALDDLAEFEKHQKASYISPIIFYEIKAMADGSGYVCGVKKRVRDVSIYVPCFLERC